jgi:NADH-quinone oxidoreductase subunit L
MVMLAWTILLAPLAAAGLVWLVGIHRKPLASSAAILGLLIAFGCALQLFLAGRSGALILPLETNFAWIALPGLTIQFGVLIDPLSLLMTLVVTGVGSAIFIYATGYMHDDAAYSRFFGVLSLFAFSMLTIVLATNWVQLFMGWELVGFSSYLLIGHWYAKPAAAEAGKKAFIVNRVADFGFMLGILMLWAYSSADPAQRTFNFLQLEHAGLVHGAMPVLIGLLLFCGPVGKSAQFPLHVWLPDAMEGPTPVSALIHAATMVAAGVYLLCRAFWLFEGLPEVMTVIMWVGGVTAFLAAGLALVENDLKRILAYSTLSQLGYMVMALGLGGRTAGMYHLTTHAFFKALLFLAAGSVIHGTHEQDIRKLGGLWHDMRWTSLTFLIGALALCGIPPLSGFFSKEAILTVAFARNPALFSLGVLTAGLTAFYTGRAWFVAFTGKARGHHGHESPPVMLIPLFVLAALSIVGGFLGLPALIASGVHGAAAPHGGAGHAGGLLVMAVSIAVVAIGLGLAWLLYGKQVVLPGQVARALALPTSFVEQRYYIDELYSWYVLHVQQRYIARSCEWVEQRVIIDGLVGGITALTRWLGFTVRLLQTGRVQAYVLVFLVGIVWLLTSALH